MKNEFIRSICLKLKDVTEDIKWEQDLCFLIGDKMFCVTGLNEEFGVSFKVKDEEFEALTTKTGISPAPYLARYNWVFVNDPKCFSQNEWIHYLNQSYELIRMKMFKRKRLKKL